MINRQDMIMRLGIQSLSIDKLALIFEKVINLVDKRVSERVFADLSIEHHKRIRDFSNTNDFDALKSFLRGENIDLETMVDEEFEVAKKELLQFAK